MTSRLEEGLPSLAPSPLPASKQLFDRDPLLIPLVGSVKPWYRKRAVWNRLFAWGFFVLMVAAVVHRFTLDGILRRFARLF
jgi:hypothetical protein